MVYLRICLDFLTLRLNRPLSVKKSNALADVSPSNLMIVKKQFLALAFLFSVKNFYLNYRNILLIVNHAHPQKMRFQTRITMSYKEKFFIVAQQ
jgi:hypothetical protein